jgi:carbonic anhydrase
MSDGKFATSISCMDGRIQIPISDWIKKNYSINYVDTITEPGVEKKITENIDIEQIKSKAEISIYKHKSDIIIVSGHHDCAGNPVSKEEHIAQIKKSVSIIESWSLPAKVIGVWVNDKWQVEQIQKNS